MSSGRPAPQIGRGMRTVRAVFFDAGETLLHPHPSFPELFTRLVAAEGFAVEPLRIQDGLALVADQFTEAARAGIRWTGSAELSKEFWLGVYRLLLDRVGLPASDGLAERLYAEFTTLSNYRLFPDAVPTLVRLHAAGIALGVISNFEEWLERLLEALDVIRYFDVRIISGIEGVEKPDPAIFQLALERGGVRAEESAYVGDIPAFDTEPAEALGMLGVLIDRRDRFPDHAGLRIASLEDLPVAIGVAG